MVSLKKIINNGLNKIVNVGVVGTMAFTFTNCGLDKNINKNSCYSIQLFPNTEINMQTGGECSFIPDLKYKPSINQVFCSPNPVNEGENFSCKVDASGDSLNYSSNFEGLEYTSSSGNFGFIAPFVDANSSKNVDFKVCNNNGCADASTSINIKDIPEIPIEEVKINSVEVDHPAEISNGKIKATCGDYVSGKINATNSIGNPIYYDATTDSMEHIENLQVNAQSYFGFDFNCGDATSDWGAINFIASGDTTKYIETLVMEGVHPYVNQAPVSKIDGIDYNENGTFTCYSSSSDPDGEIVKTQMKINNGEWGTAYYPYAATTSEIQYGDNNCYAKSVDGEGLESEVVNESFQTSSKQELLNAVETELRARGISYQTNVYSSVNPSKESCSVTGYYGTYMDIHWQQNGKNYFIHVADFSDPTDIETAKISSAYFNCEDNSAETSQFFIGNPTSSVSKIMEDFLGPN